MEPIKIGIVGAGIAATEFHIPALLELADLFKIAGVADVSPEAARRAVALVPDAMVFDSPGHLFADSEIEAIDIAVPVRHHLAVAREALQSGKHVLVEKPITSSPADADALVSVAESNPQVAMVAENFIYRQSVQKIKDLIEEGSIGAAQTVIVDFAACIPASSPYAATGWRTDSSYVGNFVVDVGIHHMAMAQYLCGPIVTSHAIVQSVNADLGDIDGVSIHYTTADGVLGIFNMFLSAPGISHDRISVVGDSGAIVGEQPESLFGEYEITVSGPGDSREYRFEGDAGYTQEFEAFHSAVRDGSPLLSTFRRGRDDLRALVEPITNALAGRRLVGLSSS